jgi:Phospholipase_D-nuclease N-terminal/Short C-terminal domain
VNYPLLGVFWTMLEVFAFVIFFFLVFTLARDIFRSDDLSGVAKAAWLVFILFVPFIGILCYLIVRGQSMRERSEEPQVYRGRAPMPASTGMTAAGTTTAPGDASVAAQLSQLADLRQRGVLSAEEFDREKAKVISAP